MVAVDIDDVPGVEVVQEVRPGHQVALEYTAVSKGLSRVTEVLTHRFAVCDLGIQGIRKDVQQVRLDRLVRLFLRFGLLDLLDSLREERRGLLRLLRKMLEEEL